MFTVIICSADFIKHVKNNYSHIFDIISKSKNCSMCVWNTQENSFETALPDLPDLISGKPQWRAVVVQDEITFGMDCISKKNPFDFVGAVSVIQDFNENAIFDQLDELLACEKAKIAVEESLYTDLNERIRISADLIKEHRQKKQNNYIAAISNPLTKLGIWLTGISEKHPQVPKEIEGLYQEDVEINREYYSRLLEEDALASEIEQYHILKHKYNTLISNFKAGSMVITKPSEILVVSERVKACSEEDFYFQPGQFEEIEYSNFCDDNLYVEKMRFVFFDINYENGRKNTKDYLAYLSSILIFAEHEIPENSIRPQRVYKGEAAINEDKIVCFYTRYLSKLQKTKNLLLGMHRKHVVDTETKRVSAQEAIDVFESDIEIPVVINREQNKDELMCQYNRIGLARDCPIEEYDYWYHQVRKITKKFVRYLREPRRAIKTAVQNDFRANNTIGDKRVVNLNEYQLEDIKYRLIEEEQKMIETKTETLFKTKLYTDKIDEADREIRKAISQRMTKKKTVIVGLLAALAYFIGFLPLIFSNLNTAKTFLFSFVLTGVLLGVFLVVGFVYLFVLKKKLINRFKHFNYVMSGILQEIENSLARFSNYLSHACNVMREFSVFKSLSKKGDVQLNIIKKHICDLEEKIQETEQMFSADYHCTIGEHEDETPYAYDFSVPCSYSYDIPHNEYEMIMEYVSKGNMVVSPIGYIDSITLTREELYD